MILLFVNPLSISSVIPTVFLLALPPFSVFFPISAALPLPIVVVSVLISGPAVVDEADLVRSYLTSDRYVGAGAAAGAGPFGV